MRARNSIFGYYASTTCIRRFKYEIHFFYFTLYTRDPVAFCPPLKLLEALHAWRNATLALPRYQSEAKIFFYFIPRRGIEPKAVVFTVARLSTYATTALLK